LQAGTCAVVSTLWPVDDRVTAMLIGRFYEELATDIGVDGRGDVAAALARAQRWLRSLTREQARRWREERGIRELPAPGHSLGPPPPYLSRTPTSGRGLWPTEGKGAHAHRCSGHDRLACRRWRVHRQRHPLRSAVLKRGRHRLRNHPSVVATPSNSPRTGLASPASTTAIIVESGFAPRPI